MLVAPDSAYVVHVHLHWVVHDRQLEGVHGVGTKDVQLVGDSKLQDLRVGISIFCGNSHIEVNRDGGRNDVIRCRYQRTGLILLNCGESNYDSLYGSNYDSLIVRTVAFPVQVAYWTKRSWPPADTVSHVNLDQWSGDMAVESRGLVAMFARQGVSRARLQAQSSHKVGVRPLLMEPGSRQRHS